ncbi:MAG TPA: hypothetical protein VIK99_01230 [Thermaerobacter sp.]
MAGWSPEQLSAAVRDLAEFGWVHVPDLGLAQAIHRAAVEAGQPAVIRKAGKGWWRVEFSDMSPLARGRKGGHEA